MIGLSHDELKKLHPCPERSRVVTKLLGGVSKWHGHKVSAADAIKAGVTFDDLVWAACAVARADKDVERRLRLWMADCAARVLHIYEKDYPADMRVRDAIIATRGFARGEIDAAARDAASGAAWAAAWDAARAADAAWAAARAADAAWAAAWAAARAADAAWAAAWAAAGAAEEQWQLDRLVQWLSDSEPMDWPLPEKGKS